MQKFETKQLIGIMKSSKGDQMLIIDQFSMLFIIFLLRSAYTRETN